MKGAGFRLAAEHDFLPYQYFLVFGMETKPLDRPFERGDELSIVRHANNRNVWINLRDHFPHPYRMADARRWIDEVDRDRPFFVFVNYMEAHSPYLPPEPFLSRFLPGSQRVIGAARCSGTSPSSPPPSAAPA